MTAAYFCCMSKRFASCGPTARSPTQLDTTSGRKPCDIASTTLARTHPLVTAPATINVCTARCDNHGASCVPKNAEGTVLRTTSSPAAGVSSGTIALFGWSSVSVAMPGTFSENTLSSLPSAAYTMRLCATGQPCRRAAASRCTVRSIAGAMLPPPKVLGSAKPTTKSTISRPILPFTGNGVPNPCCLYTPDSAWLWMSLIQIAPRGQVLSVHHHAIADHGFSVERYIAMPQRDVDMTSGRTLAACFVVRPKRKQEVAFEGAGIHADGRFSVIQSEGGPACARLQTPSDMRDRIAFGIVERGHIVA